MKEFNLKLTLGMAERRLTESPTDEESWGGGQRFKSRPDPKVTLSQTSRLFIDILYIVSVVIGRTINSPKHLILLVLMVNQTPKIPHSENVLLPKYLTSK